MRPRTSLRYAWLNFRFNFQTADSSGSVIANASEAIQGNRQELDCSQLPCLVVPALSRDPYAVPSRLGSEADAFCTKQRQGLWVPAQGRDDVDDCRDSIFKQPIQVAPSLRAPAKQSRATSKDWIASSQVLLAMTLISQDTPPHSRDTMRPSCA
jgi:hypothetical protein